MAGGQVVLRAPVRYIFEMRSRLARTLPVLMLACLAGCTLQGTQEGSALPEPSASTAPGAETRREIAVQALSFLGVPYRYGGRQPETGFDCSGLVHYVVGKVTGMVLPVDTRGLREAGSSISAEELQPGDLVFFNTLRRPYSHVGIYLGRQRFVHAPSSGGVVEVVSMAQSYWRRRYDGARRLPF